MLSQWSRPTLREPPSPPISPPPSPPSPPPSPPSPPSPPRGNSSPPRGDSSPPTADASSSAAYLTSPRVHARVPDFWAGAKPLPSRRPPAPCRAPPLALRAHPAGVTRALNTAPNRALETALETRATGGSGCDRWGREHFRQPAPPLIPQPTPPEFPQLASPIGTNGLFGRKQFDEGGNQPDEGGNRATANSPIGTNGLFGRKQFEKMVWGLGEPHDHEPRDRTDTANTPVRSRRDLGSALVRQDRTRAPSCSSRPKKERACRVSHALTGAAVGAAARAPPVSTRAVVGANHADSSQVGSSQVGSRRRASRLGRVGSRLLESGVDGGP